MNGSSGAHTECAPGSDGEPPVSHSKFPLRDRSLERIKYCIWAVLRQNRLFQYCIRTSETEPDVVDAILAEIAELAGHKRLHLLAIQQ